MSYCTARDNFSGFVPFFSLQRRAKGQTLLELVFNHLDLIECDYFGLRYSDSLTISETKRWLDPLKSIRKQVKGQLPIIELILTKNKPLSSLACPCSWLWCLNLSLVALNLGWPCCALSWPWCPCHGAPCLGVTLDLGLGVLHCRVAPRLDHGAHNLSIGAPNLGLGAPSKIIPKT